MTQLDLALIEPIEARFCRSLRCQEPQQWPLRDCTLRLWPLICKDQREALRRGLNLALANGCTIVALPPTSRTKLRQAPLFLADGRLFQLSSLPQCLDLDCPGWRKDQISLSADDTFSCLAARLLAPLVARLHLFGKNSERRLALAQLIYQESGLIASNSSQAATDSLIILPSDSEVKQANSAYIWQNWPAAAYTDDGQYIEAHLAEGLLLAAGRCPQPPLELLHTLHKRSLFQMIIPV